MEYVTHNQMIWSAFSSNMELWTHNYLAMEERIGSTLARATFCVYKDRLMNRTLSAEDYCMLQAREIMNLYDELRTHAKRNTRRTCGLRNTAHSSALKLIAANIDLYEAQQIIHYLDKEEHYFDLHAKDNCKDKEHMHIERMLQHATRRYCILEHSMKQLLWNRASIKQKISIANKVSQEPEERQQKAIRACYSDLFVDTLLDSDTFKVYNDTLPEHTKSMVTDILTACYYAL